MTRINDKVLFSALGCLAIIAKGKEGKKNAATQAEILAGYIESYCHQMHPDAFPLMFDDRNDGGWSIYDQIVQRAKEDIKRNGTTELPESYDLKTMLYHRLQKRQRTYMAPALINGEINHLLTLESQHVKNEAKMMIMTLEGDPTAFVPYERMAKMIAEVLETKEECFPSDLDDSFSDEEIKKHWATAHGLAQIERIGS